MPQDMTDISKMPTAGGNVNAPASGTYGEGAALERLKQQLPMGAPGGGPAAAPTPPMPQPGAGAGMPGAQPAGLPPALLRPTSQPNVPVSTPLGPPQQAADPGLSGRQRRMQVLDVLANDPNVSETTREWATTVMNHLIARTKG